MRRTIIILLISFLTLFIIVTQLKERSTHVILEGQNSGKTVVEKENIQRFWEIYRKATEYRITGKLDAAATEYRKAIELNNYHEDALYYLGNMYVELGKLEEAEQTWKRLVKINANSARTHFQLGDLYISVEEEKFFNIDAAEAEYLRAHEINKEETGSTLRLGYVALIRGDLSETQRYFDAVIGSNYKSVEAYFLNGYVAWKRGNPQKALTLLETAGKYLHPELPVQGVLGEGDTKEGHSFSLSDSSRHQTLFEVFIRELSKMDEKSFSQQMDNLYEKLDVFLKEIREKI